MAVTPPWAHKASPVQKKKTPWAAKSNTKPAAKPVSGINAKNPQSPSSQKLAHRTAENMTPKMKLVRDQFVAQFIIDFDQTKACMRLGTSAATAAKKGSEYMREPYVQQKLTEYLDEMEEDSLISRNRILGGLWREANFDGMGGNSASRVSALSKLAKLKGMEIERVEVKTVNAQPLTPDEVKTFLGVFDEHY